MPVFKRLLAIKISPPEQKDGNPKIAVFRPVRYGVRYQQSSASRVEEAISHS
jgi:hypothetical protein